VDVWDKAQKNLLFTDEFTSTTQVLPTTTTTINQLINHQLDIGQYWAAVSIPFCKESKLLTFDIVERGMVSDRGELVRIEAPSKAVQDEIVAIKAVFRNSGQRLVSAKFKGTIERDNKIVKVIDTDFVDVEPRQVVGIEDFFQPDKTGEYVIKGRVLYNNKLTYEQDAVLEVVSGGPTGMVTGQDYFSLTTANLVIVVIIIALIILIIYRKRRRKGFYP
jgi:hypothetical protein